MHKCQAGVYGNRTHCERSSHPPLVLKTRPGTSRGNTPEGWIPLGNPGQHSVVRFYAHMILESTDVSRNLSLALSLRSAGRQDISDWKALVVGQSFVGHGRPTCSVATPCRRTGVNWLWLGRPPSCSP